MFPIPLPWILISATIALFGTYQVGHHYGWLERDEEMQIEIAKKNEEARELEKNMTSKLADKETALRKAKNEISKKQSAMRELANTYAELITNQFQKSNDQFIWTASTASGDCSNGLNYYLSSATTGVVVPASVTGSAFSAANALTVMDTMIDNLSSDVADRDDLTFFMSVSNFRKYVTAIRTANNFYFDPASITNRGGVMDMMYPFQNIRVVGTVGLQGTDRVVLGPAKHIVVGTDLRSDVTEFQMWYDINADQLKHRLVMKLGVNVAYPEFWVSNNRS